ncbi:NADPH-dependent F420 reductase [Rathayibacter sp. SD072]|uniref:NADPH-dependent F420 reductase n=1 Tax=Rathayibacter sp. SD072 TaxID=2781731 RepID=UPI001A971D12|nr:NAD(P)-binding domain-containing protein [Rathayibacter sp. SD072]MBO0983340.1 NAD(P)-binding domain-containing protein [Rathayibacter sp. SD072]
MKRIGIIGGGDIGSGIARLAIAAGHEVLIANSRGPESLRDLIDELGPNARSGDVLEAATFGDITVLAVPLGAYRALPEGALAGRTVLSTGNYYPHRDGRIARLDALELTTAELEQELLPGAIVIKAFTNILAHHIPSLAGSSPRTALAVSGDDEQGKAAAAALVDDLGFEPVDAGTLAQSWRTEPESGAYTPLYAADPEGLAKDYLADRGAPVSADRLRELIAASHRADVAARTF